MSAADDSSEAAAGAELWRLVPQLAKRRGKAKAKQVAKDIVKIKVKLQIVDRNGECSKQITILYKNNNT